MAKKEIHTSIQIFAPIERVWQVLTDFENYKSWNPFIESIEGNVELGKTIRVRAGGMNFSPIVLDFDANDQLKWRGKLVADVLFSGEHYFRVEKVNDAETTFLHGEYFQGILVSILSGKLEDTRLGFESMNQALKEECERKGI
ncbi:SRPBCC domain-containing protein [Reichenbachiella versicolor]|uniref:SRPBCC domain-containing protein n=1 Tax=Reichenbachiella versicolor TaxID=1821036 RepID=UPI000D6DD01D|nr:SRPBCC domain-containing protein [Reichenbachiella versicolor]